MPRFAPLTAAALAGLAAAPAATITEAAVAPVLAHLASLSQELTALRLTDRRLAEWALGEAVGRANQLLSARPDWEERLLAFWARRYAGLRPTVDVTFLVSGWVC